MMLAPKIIRGKQPKHILKLIVVFTVILLAAGCSLIDIAWDLTKGTVKGGY